QIVDAALPKASKESREAFHLQQQLHSKNRAMWEKEVPTWARSVVDFKRGFVWYVQCRAAPFLEAPAKLWSQAPVTMLSLREAFVHLEEVVRLSELVWLRSLVLSDNHLGDKQAKALALSPHLKNITSLILNGNKIGAAGLKALIGSPHLRQ